MPEMYTFDNDPRREERADLGEGLAFSLITNTLRAVEDNPSLFSHVMAIQNKDHEDYSDQQNKTARILRIAMTGGFLMVAANLIVISQVNGVATRIILGGASAAGLGLVYYLRATMIHSNRDLLKERNAIRAEAVALIDKQDQNIEILRDLLKESEHLHAIVVAPQEKESPN